MRAGHINILASVSALALVVASPALAQSVTTSGSVAPVHAPNPSATWTIADQLIIGNDAAGSLTIADGGIATVDTNLESAIGSGVGGLGIVDISGVNSRLSVLRGGLSVGISGGQGEMTVSGGARLDVVGYVNVVVTGNVTRYFSGDYLEIGNGGAGLLTVEAGGTVATDYLRLGNVEGSPARVVLDGVGSLIDVRESLVAGWEGGGDVVVSGGARLQTQSDSQVSLATRTAIFPDQIGGDGGASVLVTGAGSVWESGGQIRIGENGPGVLTIEDGALVSAMVSGIVVGSGRAFGDPFELLSQLIVDNATLEAGYLQFGNAGATSDVHFINGAQVTSGGLFAAGGSVRGTGFVFYPEVDVLVSGVGTRWVNGANPTGFTDAFRVGMSGTSRFNVLDGASVETLADMILGDSGSEAHGGSVFFTIADGGTVQVGGDAILGRAEDSVGEMTVSGAASAWSIDGSLAVGDGASGRLLVEAAGLVELGEAALIGAVASGSGDVTVQGAGAAFDVGDYLNVGALGEGTLRVEDQGQVIVANNSLIAQGNGSTGTVTVTGAGSVWTSGGYLAVGNAGQAALTIADGGTVISQGVATSGSGGSRIARLAGSEGSTTVTGAGSLWDTGANLIVGYAGDGSLVVQDEGTARAARLDIALAAGSTGRVFIGGVDAPASVGVLDTDLVAFGAGNGSLVFNHNSENYSFSLPVTGAGTIEHRAGMTVLAGNNASFAGDIDIVGGQVDMAGAYGGTTSVGAGGLLVGTGQVGDLVVNGRVSPGNSIGTLTVGGDLTFNAGSIFAIEVDAPDLSDRIDVGGTATVNGGAIEISKLSVEDSYQAGQTYRIINAQSLVRNAEFSLNQPFLFLRADLDYGADRVDLTLSAAGDFTDEAQTFNQRQVAGALSDLEQTGDALAVYNEFLFLTDATEARRAFDLSSGEIHASGQQVIDQTFALFAHTLRQQGAAGLGGGSMGGQVYTAPLGYSPTPRPASLPAGAMAADTPDLPTDAYADARVAQAWLAPLGGRGLVETDGNAGELDWWTAGLAGGYEGPIEMASGNAWAGFGFGYMRSHGAVDARLSTLDADNFQIGVYGGWADGPWSVAGSLAYSASSVSTERRIVFGGIDRTAEADYWNHTVSFSGEAAYGFDLASGTKISPLFTLDAGWSGHGGFTETGAGALNLTGGSEDWTRLDTGLGLAVVHTFVTESGNLTLDGRAVWERAFADVVPSQNLAFAGSPTGFTVNGPDAGRDRLRIGLGLAFEATEDMTIRANYSGLFSGNQQSHGASVGLNIKF